MKEYQVFDTTGHRLAIFYSYRDASTYCTIHGRHDWTIRVEVFIPNRQSTERQRRAVSFVEDWCNISFEGNINDFYEVSDFLADYLDTAKEIASDAAASYWSILSGLR